MNPDLVNLSEKIFPMFFGALGTYLAVRKFYEDKHREELKRNAESETKAYAAQRDFEHLRRNQEQLKEGLNLIDHEISVVQQNMAELKGVIFTLMKNMPEFHSGIFGYKERKE